MTVSTQTTVVAEHEVLQNCIHHFLVHPVGVEFSQVARREITVHKKTMSVTSSVYTNTECADCEDWDKKAFATLPLKYERAMNGREGVVDAWKFTGAPGTRGEIIITYFDGTVLTHPFVIVEGPVDEVLINGRFNERFDFGDDEDDDEGRLIDEIC